MLRITVISLIGSSLLPAQEKVSFDDHIFPIFEQACLNCHNPDDAKGGLDLSNFAGTMKGGSSGKIVDPGDPGSTLVKVVTRSTEPVMPPEGDKLPEDRINLIVQWIEGGLLENKSSTARKPAKPKFETTLRSDPSAKPHGPPPMPEHLLLEPVILTERPAAVHSMVASPWAPLLAITGQKQILLHHTETLDVIGILPFPEGDPISLAFTPDARYLIVGGGVPGKNGLTVTFDITNGSRVVTAGREFDSILAADIRPGFDIVATGGPSKLLKLWNTETGEQIQSIKKHTEWITALDISPDGVLLASGDRNGGIHIWEANSGNEFHTLRAHQTGITSLVYRSDSNLLASASEDGSVRFWEMDNGSEVRKIDAHPGGVTTFAFAGNGGFVTGGRDNKARLWKADFNQLREIPLPNLPTASAIDWTIKRAFVADALGLVHTFSAGESENAEVITFPTNPTSIESRLQHIAALITGVQDKIQAAQAAEEDRNTRIQAADDRLAAAEKAHEQAKQILQATHRGVNEARQKLDHLGANPETPADELQKATAALDASHKTNKAAQGRIEPTRGKIEEAKQALGEAEATPAGGGTDLAALTAEIENLRGREKLLSAATINTHALKAAEETLVLSLQSEQHLDAFAQKLVELSHPAAALNEKRALRSEFAAALKKSTPNGLHLEEAQATLRAIDQAIKNLHEDLSKHEIEIATMHESINTTSRSLAGAKSQSQRLRTSYRQALE